MINPISLWGWRNIFRKAGRNGLLAFIPVIRYYQLFSISGIPVLFPVCTGIQIIAIIISFLVKREEDYLIFLGVYLIIVVFLRIITANELCSRFNSSKGLTVGLIILPGIFAYVLGNNSDKYFPSNNQKTKRVLRKSMVPYPHFFMITFVVSI